MCRTRSWCAKAQLAQEALTHSNWNVRITMEIFLLKSREEIGPLLLQQDQNTEKITTLSKQLREQIESGKRTAGCRGFGQVALYRQLQPGPGPSR